MSEEITIGKRFTIVVPRSIRKKLGLREGQKALVRTEGQQVVVEPLTEDPYKVLAETLGDLRYSESRYEKKAEEWLKRVARPRHRTSVRS
jgi:AbrB family looped-hinge helix DNA binding protein